VLSGRTVLLVEDEFLIAADMIDFFEDLGARVAGPFGNVTTALEAIGLEGRRYDIGVLDINLHGGRSWPVADALSALSIPFVLVTGYDADTMPEAYRGAPQCLKPVDKSKLLRIIGGLLTPPT
jgi:DNA-binding NtrC family response regulator